MGQSLALLQYHFIFGTKDRTELIRPELRERLHEYIGGIIRKRKGRLLAAGGTGDHVHLLAILHPERAVSDIIRDVKANSSKWIHENYADLAAFAWQDGYGAFSVSASNVTGVREYIARQEEHHRKVSFREEFLSFLEANGIEYDERYLWR